MGQTDCKSKSKAPIEFGAKISISVVDSYTFIDWLTFDAYNEGESSEFERVVEMYHSRFGHYPERILVDKIYRSKDNRAFCKSHGIRISGPKLGRPGKNHAGEIRQELQETGKRKTQRGLSLITAKMQITTKSMMGMNIFILNIEKKMWWSSSLICVFLDILMIRLYPCNKRLTTTRISGCYVAV